MLGKKVCITPLSVCLCFRLISVIGLTDMVGGLIK